MPPVIPGAHAAESGPARAAQQTQKHVFLGVSGMMAQQNPVRAAAAALFFQRGIAQTAGGFFHAFALTAPAGNIHGRHAAGNAQRGADADGMRCIVAGFRSQAVIDAQGAQLPAPRRSQTRKQGSQRERVRAAGNGKTFLYTGNLWAPLMLDGKPTLYLVAQAALSRNLGDALPLGNFKRGNVRIYLFANGKNPAAVLFTDSTTPVKLPLSSARVATAEEMFGRKLDATAPILSRETPVFLRNVPDSMVRAALAEQIAFHSSEPEGKQFRPLIDKLMKCSDKQFTALLDREIAAIRTMRRTASAEQLYVSNKVLDLLVHARIMLARRSGTDSIPAADLPALRRKIDAAWKAAGQRTGGNGALLHTERLISRAQKEMQFAEMYASDGDTVARDLFAACAADDLANAEARLPQEKVAKIYKSKSYFRSHKRRIRSELYCFPNGRPQEAVVTLANPFGRELPASMTVTVPAGWKAVPDRLTGTVPPFSRLLLKLEITAPEKFTPGEKAKILLRDENGNFPPIEAECEILKKIPAYPVLGGPISGGEFTGN